MAYPRLFFEPRPAGEAKGVAANGRARGRCGGDGRRVQAGRDAAAASELLRRGDSHAIGSACIGGGQGVAITLEAVK